MLSDYRSLRLVVLAACLGAVTTVHAGHGRNRGIFYRDNPYTGGAAELTVDMSGVSVVNGIGFGVVSISGATTGVAATAVAQTNSVTITPTVEGSCIVAGYGAQAGANGAASPPLIQLYGGDIGSAEGAAGYDVNVANVPLTYSFSGGNDPKVSCAAAFSPSSTRGMLVLIR